MKIVVLDGATLGEDIDLSPLFNIGEVTVYPRTAESEIGERLSGADCAVVNKLKMNEATLRGASELKLICVAATGYDNIDLNYCEERNIAVCNVLAYSTDSVAQVTVAMVLSLFNRLEEYREYVNDGRYTERGLANALTPVYHEIAGKKWGIVGLGNIGRKVATVALALGCEVVAYKREPVSDFKCVDIDNLIQICDIITIHTPLNDGTRNLINKDRIAKLKEGAVIVNVARGAVCDEAALAEAAKSGKIFLGVDVYTTEPFGKDHPFYELRELDNVCMTPHMAWGSYESRNRCVSEIAENIKAFEDNKKRNRLV